MNTKKLLLLVFTGFSVVTNAQSYEFTATTGTYTDLANSTSLNGTAPWDDPEFLIPIGFDFQYFDTVMNQIYIDDWGFGAELTPDPNETGILPILIPYGADIADRAYDFNNQDATTGSLSTISYLLEGMPGSRVLKIEWKNVGFQSDIFANNSSTDFTNFQLWLYEGSNDIEIHFGPNSITQPGIVFDGETGSSVALVPMYDFDDNSLIGSATVLSGDPAIPTVNTATDLNTFFLNGAIPNGTIYKFSMMVLDTEEFAEKSTYQTYPNPSNAFIKVSGIVSQKNYEIYSILGTKVAEGRIQPDEQINVQRYSNGMYIIQLEDSKPLRFIKN